MNNELARMPQRSDESFSLDKTKQSLLLQTLAI